MEGICHRCRAPLSAEGVVRRNAACPSCGADVRVCRNCRWHDPAAYNACRESQAERVLEKDRGNFCEYFSLGVAGAAQAGRDKGAAARRRLEDLFRQT